MMQYFHRQIQLWGEETQKSLTNKKIAIIGAGGLGSSLSLALGASGIGEIHIVDFDNVSIHNIHRQINFKLKNEGKNKAKISAKLMESRCPYMKSYAYNMNFDEFTKKSFDLDLILDASDNLQTRQSIDQYSKKTNIPWIYASVESFNGQVCFFKDATFNKIFNIIKRKPEGLAAPIVMQVGSLQANLALRYLAGLEVKRDILYYLNFNKEGEFISKKFNILT